MWLRDRSHFDEIQRRVHSGDPEVRPYADALRAQAESLLRGHAPAVTDKSLTVHSPSKDLHDYVSVAT